MGQGNAAVKQWIERPDRFADLFNGYVFQGEQVILPEELEPVSGESDILLTDKEGKAQEIARHRDVIMRWKKEAVFVMLACENQEEVHYAMPVRNMVYDGLAYTDQIQRLWKKRVEETSSEGSSEKNQTGADRKGNSRNSRMDKKLTSAEFLSKFTKEDSLIPVITLVFYYGIEPWDGSTDLYGMFRWGKKKRRNQILKKFIPNYPINLIDANKIDNLKHFHTDLQEIMGVLQCRGDKEKLLEYINERADYFQNVDEETYHFMRVALHSEKLLKENIERSKGEDGVNMCKALEDLYNDGVECGIEQGEIKGMVKICRSFKLGKDDAAQRLMEELKISKEKAEEGVEMYWE